MPAQKKPDDRKRVRQAPKGKGRLKQVLANALFGRCFPANKHLSGVLDGGGLVFPFQDAEKRSSWSILNFIFSELFVQKFNGVKIFRTSCECRKARSTDLAMLRLSGERSFVS